MRRGWFRKAWRYLSRLHLGVILLAVLLGAIIVGTLFPRLPQQTDPDTWWQAVRDRYGALYAPLRALGLFDTFGSLWFQGLLTLLLLSALACFLNRVWPLSRVVFRPRTRLPAERFERAALRAELRFSSLQDADFALRAALRRRHYRVQTESWDRSEDPSQHQLYLRADRHHLPRMGTLLTHIGLIALLLSAAWSGVRGWRTPSLAVSSDRVTAVGHSTGIGLRCDRFTVLRDDDGAPRDYRAQVALIAQNGEAVIQGTVHVNRPLTHGGVSYHLQGFHLQTSSAGSVAETETCDVTLSAVHDPGYGMVIAAGLCLLAGVTLTFHFPHRRLWSRVAATGETTLVGTTTWDRERFAHQFEALVAELRKVAEASITHHQAG
jgi:cytochrome c biogenesis protein